MKQNQGSFPFFTIPNKDATNDKETYYGVIEYYKENIEGFIQLMNKNNQTIFNKNSLNKLLIQLDDKIALEEGQVELVNYIIEESNCPQALNFKILFTPLVRTFPLDRHIREKDEEKMFKMIGNEVILQHKLKSDLFII